MNILKLQLCDLTNMAFALLQIHHLTYWTCFSKEYPPDTKPVTTTSNPDLNGNASTMTNTACDDKCQILNSEKLPDNIQEVLGLEYNNTVISLPSYVKY